MEELQRVWRSGDGQTKRCVVGEHGQLAQHRRYHQATLWRVNALAYAGTNTLSSAVDTAYDRYAMRSATWAGRYRRRTPLPWRHMRWHWTRYHGTWCRYGAQSMSDVEEERHVNLCGNYWTPVQHGIGTEAECAAHCLRTADCIASAWSEFAGDCVLWSHEMSATYSLLCSVRYGEQVLGVRMRCIHELPCYRRYKQCKCPGSGKTYSIVDIDLNWLYQSGHSIDYLIDYYCGCDVSNN